MKGLTLSLLIFSSMQFSQAVATVKVSRCVRSVEVSTTLENEIYKLEAELGRDLRAVEREALQLSQLDTEIQDVARTMTWRERNLWPWIARKMGGDRDRIEKYVSLRVNRANLEAQMQKDRASNDRQVERMDYAIDRWLRRHDERFAELRDVERKLYQLVCRGQACLQVVEVAAKARREARLTKNLDTISNNKFLAMRTTRVIKEAEKAEHEADVAAREYLDRIHKLRAYLQSRSDHLFEDPPRPGKSVLVIDWEAFPFRFDYEKEIISQKGAIEDLRTYVENLRNGVDKEYRSLQKVLNDIVRHVHEDVRRHP